MLGFVKRLNYQNTDGVSDIAIRQGRNADTDSDIWWRLSLNICGILRSYTSCRITFCGSAGFAVVRRWSAAPKFFPAKRQTTSRAIARRLIAAETRINLIAHHMTVVIVIRFEMIDIQ